MNWRVGRDDRRELVSDAGEILADVVHVGLRRAEGGKFRARIFDQDRQTARRFGTTITLPDFETREAAQHAAEIKLHMVS